MKRPCINTVNRQDNERLLASTPTICLSFKYHYYYRTGERRTMKLSQLCCTAALAAGPVMAILAKFCPSELLVYPVNSD
jgi:hypothetical protein